MPPLPKYEHPVNMREAENVLMITVCEGDGKEIPMQLVKYIVRNGEILGKIDPQWETKGTLTQ